MSEKAFTGEHAARAGETGDAKRADLSSSAPAAAAGSPTVSDTGVERLREKGALAARLWRLAQEEFVLVVLLATFAVVFLTVFPPTLLVADSWLTLAAGREIVENGLPTRDELTVLGADRTWTDQQWGAHALAYLAHEVGGHALLSMLAAALVVGAFAIGAIAARTLGAGSRAVAVILLPVVAAAPWAWTIRAQLFALPLFTGLLWLLATEARRPTRRVYAAFPLLVIWANMHGSVLAGAALVMLLGAIELVRGRRGLRAVALLLLPPLAVVATPYGPVATARYYHLLVVDPPFGRELVIEWRRSDPSVRTLLFYCLAALAVALVVWGRRRLTAYDVGALLLTFAGGVTAIRGIVWFALACLVLLPVAIGLRLEPSAARARPSLNAALSVAAAALVALSLLVAVARDEGWYTKNWPPGAVAAVRQAAADQEVRVFANSRDADWMLWQVPELRGRLAYDVRFEIYDRATFERIVRFRGKVGPDWKSITDGFDVVVLRTTDLGTSHVPDFLSERSARRVYADDRVTVVRRQLP
jgi:hypothetical protein